MTYSVLIVDDSKLARMAIGKALHAIHPDWTRVEATNADEALALMETRSIDLALLDFNMPGRDGLALAADLKKLQPPMPVAVISANYQDEIIAQTRELGAEFLAKPVTDATLRQFLAGAVEKLAAR